MIRLEGEAAKGDTLVDPLIAATLPDSMKLREEHGGWVITGSTGDEPSGPGRRHIDAQICTDSFRLPWWSSSLRSRVPEASIDSSPLGS